MNVDQHPNHLQASFESPQSSLAAVAAADLAAQMRPSSAPAERVGYSTAAAPELAEREGPVNARDQSRAETKQAKQAKSGANWEAAGTEMQPLPDQGQTTPIKVNQGESRRIKVIAEKK